MNMRSEGLDKIINDFAAHGLATGEFAKECLAEGAEVVKKAWKQAALQHDLIGDGSDGTGRHMRSSIDITEAIGSVGWSKGASGNMSDVLRVAIYPQGVRRVGKKSGRPVRNAEVAYVLHYGTSKRPATYWVDTAEDIATPEVERLLVAKLKQHQEKNNL